MAIKEIRREWSPCQLDYVKEFLLHSEADVKDLPACCVGSKARVGETGNVYTCSASGEWTTKDAEGVDGCESAAHKMYVTDGEGKPHWEDKLAYEESTEEVILPPTTIFSMPGKQTTLSVKAAKAINEGDTGVLTINDVDYPYTGIKGTASGLTDSIQLSTEGDANHNVYVNPVTLSVNVVGKVGCGYKNFTFSIVERSTTIKPLDPKYLPEGVGGGGGVMYIADTSTLIQAAYADAALTTKLSYEQGKEIAAKPFAVGMNLDGMFGSLFPVMAYGDDSAKVINIVIITPEAGAAAGMTLTFSDTP